MQEEPFEETADSPYPIPKGVDFRHDPAHPRMSQWFKFSLLWFLTGSPVTAAVILLVFWVFADWYTLGLVRRGLHVIRNIQSVSRLSRVIAVNPHDRKARTDLGNALIELRRFDQAIRVLKPVLDADADDTFALYLLGLACLGAGKVEQGELFIGSVIEKDPGYRQSDPFLQLGRYRLARGDAKGAEEALTRYLSAHPASVQAHYLMARSAEMQGDSAAAQRARERAWTEYTTALPYQRRVERLWAWRTRPSRPLLYAAVTCALLAAVGSQIANRDFSSLRRSALALTPEAGFQNGIAPEGTACGACLRERCGPMLTRVGAEPEVAAYQRCLLGCSRPGDPSCRSRCDSEHPVGQASMAELGSCGAAQCKSLCD